MNHKVPAGVTMGSNVNAFLGDGFLAWGIDDENTNTFRTARPAPGLGISFVAEIIQLPREMPLARSIW
jgi:hypothetical protein